MQDLIFFVEPWSAFHAVSAIAIIVELISFASAFHALRHVRTSQATVAWVVGLIAMPWLTLPLYWIFARNRFAGYREAIRDVEKSHRASVTAVHQELTTPTNSRSTRQVTPLEQIADVLDTPLCGGNEFELLVDGSAFFDKLIEQIDAAESYVYLSYYIIRDDVAGNRFADVLTRRASDGVTVRLLYDEIGCLRLSSRYLNRLRDGGVDVRAFYTRQGWFNRFQINFRNHRKLAVIDGRTTLVGGLNIGDEYFGTPDLNWRDTAILSRGPIAKKVQAVFAGDYYWAARTNLPEANWDHEAKWDFDVFLPETVTGQAAVCATGPADPRPRATMMFVAAITSATERVWISSPYLVPDDALMVALAMAKARGVDVRLLIPSMADEWAVYLAGFYYEREMAQLDIPVFRYQDALLHQKCVLVDDSLVLLGSANFDNRSLYLNFELMLAVDDPQLIADTAQMLKKDFARSTQTGATPHPLQPLLSRAGTAIARLFSPVL